MIRKYRITRTLVTTVELDTHNFDEFSEYDIDVAAIETAEQDPNANWTETDVDVEEI